MHGKSRIRSGFYDKPNDNIVHKMKWVHKCLEYTYSAKNVEFTKMSFYQFVAGETKIIATTQDFDEEQGRLRLLNNISYALDDTGNWSACRDYYTAIIVAIEKGEEEWVSNFR